MSVCTIRFTDRVDELPSDGWRVSVEMPNAPTHEAAGTQVSIVYPFDRDIERDIRWHLETYPVYTPWKISVLHEIGTAPNIDGIIIDVVETGSTSSNIFQLHWEIFENPVVWDELWALVYPPNRFRRPKAIPKVTVRRTVYVADPSYDDYGMDSLSLDDLSLSESGNGRTIVESSYKQVHESDERRSIVKEQAAEYNMVWSEMQVHQKLDVSVSFFRILLVVARRIDTEKSRKPPSTEDRHRMFDIDPLLIFEPLFEAISILPKDLDVRLEVCRPGSWDALQNTLREKGRGYYDLVHFDMHGGVSDTEGSGLYFLSSETDSLHENFGKIDFVPAGKIGALLYEAGVIMAALNACETAREAPIMDPESRNERHPNDLRNDQSTEEPSTSDIQTNLAKVLVKSGIPSVLAMSYKAIPSFVSIFFKNFYKALLQSKSDVAEAATTARKALLSEKQRAVGYGLTVELADWIIPVLYQGYDVTFSLASPDVTRSNPSPDHRTIEATSGRRRLFRRLFPRNPTGENVHSAVEENSAAHQSTNRMIGRGLEVLYVEALLLNINSRRTLCLSGKPGIGKTHFVKGVAEYWFCTGCISDKALYIDCFAHSDWRALDVLREIVQGIVGLDASAENVEKTQHILRSSKMLVILDNVEEQNLSLKPEDKKAKHDMQSFIQSLKGGQSVMIIVSRADLEHQPRHQPRLLRKETRGCIEFWQLSERNQGAIQEVTLDLLRKLDKNTKLGSKYETRDLGRVLQCLEQNPLIISLFLQTMSDAGFLSNLKNALHHILFGLVPLPLTTPQSRMVFAAQKAYTDLKSMANGQDLQKLALCLCCFNNVIPCSLDEKVFFPSATCYLGYLRAFFVLPWPTTADPSIIREGVELSKNRSQLRTQLAHLSQESVESFCVLINHFLGTGLVDFMRQDQQDETSRRDIKDWGLGVLSTRQLLSKLKYLRINPVLTHYLRGQAEPKTSTKGEIISRPHGLNIHLVQIAYCAYFKSFSISGMEEHNSRHQPTNPQSSTTNSQPAISASDIVFRHDAPNFYSAVHTAMCMPHPKMRWESIPVWALVNLASKATQTFNPNARYEPLRTGAFTEETILSMLRLVLDYHDSAPRGERKSFTPLTYAALLSSNESLLMSFVGGSEYSDIQVYRRQLRERVTRALSTMQELRALHEPPGTPPDDAERVLQMLLEDIVSEERRTVRSVASRLTTRPIEPMIRQVIGEDRWTYLQNQQRDNRQFATAVRGGLRTD